MTAYGYSLWLSGIIGLVGLLTLGLLVRWIWDSTIGRNSRGAKDRRKRYSQWEQRHGWRH